MTARRVPAIKSGAVQLWRASRTATGRELARLTSVVSAAERERADAFYSEIDRDRYVVGRARLRELLGNYLHADPASLALEAGEHGKPFLADPVFGWLGFNIAHSGDMVVYAIARDRAVGVDVEGLAPDIDVEGIARRFFTSAERRLLAGLAPSRRPGACIALWTRKEAVLKEFGVGLTMPPAQLEALPGRPARTLSGASSTWSVAAFSAGPGYRGAVAVRRPGTPLPRTAMPLVSG